MNEKIIIISGPTASGKSALALQMADFKDIAIINADALQVYEGLPILSSQPTKAEEKIAPHFLYSCFSSSESCSVGLWLKLTESTVKTVFDQGKIPVIVGGTGMYISKLLNGINEIPAIDESLKIKARQLYEDLGHEKFIENLIALGENEEKIKNLDKHRLIRVCEVLWQTKKSIFWWHQQPNKFLFDPKIFTHVNLNPERKKLYENCDLRFKKMLKCGAIEEAQALIAKGVDENSQIAKTLGFLEIKDFLDKKISHEKLIEISSQKTRNYAKRQLTWFRNQCKDSIVFADSQAAIEFLRIQ